MALILPVEIYHITVLHLLWKISKLVKDGEEDEII